MTRKASKAVTNKKKIQPVDFEKYRYLPVTNSKAHHVSDPKISPGLLIKAVCEFDFHEAQLTLHFKAGHISWTPEKLTLFFRKQAVTSSAINLKNLKVNEVFSICCSFKNVPIDFFGFSKDRVFKVELDFFSSQLPGAKLRSTFEIPLPVLKLKELDFKRPKVLNPSKDVQTVCRQGFQMNSANSNNQISICIELEEFRIIPIKSRYERYNYCDMLNLFIDIENSFEIELLDKICINNAKIEKMQHNWYKIATALPTPSAASSVILTPMNLIYGSSDNKKQQTHVPIFSYHQKYITVQVPRKAKQLDENLRYHVKFVPNLFSSAVVQASLKHIESHGFDEFLLRFGIRDLPKQSKNLQYEQFEQFHDWEWMNAAVGQNNAQSQAIKHIVNRTSFPAPYIVFGPPGTGKTSTLVEAVAQITKLLPKARIVITVNSNSACDEIGERLLKFIGANQLFRFYSPSIAMKTNRIHPKLKPCSNLKYGYHVQPSAEELLSYNVIISTLVNVARLKLLGSDVFDFIFVDECASSAEAFVTIPLSLAMDQDKVFKTSIVLLGDPKQLGQIMRTHHNERFGFNISMMERVMEMENYKFPFNPCLITQLTDNFRSHKKILAYSNKEFYNSILQAKQAERVANFAIGWKLLPNPEIPIIFHASWTPSEIEGTSQFNSGEIAIVRKYVRCLLAEGINGKKVAAKDIGIISPYAIQRERLKEIYQENIEIGTVEYFQGREKLIIILTCVRSKTQTVGFLKNEKRLNVSLTRAKALLIVVGNPETLGKNKFWRNFIKLCCENKAKIGKVPNWVTKPVSGSSSDDDEMLRLEELMNGMGMDD